MLFGQIQASIFYLYWVRQRQGDCQGQALRNSNDKDSDASNNERYKSLGMFYAPTFLIFTVRSDTKS